MLLHGLQMNESRPFYHTWVRTCLNDIINTLLQTELN